MTSASYADRLSLSALADRLIFGNDQTFDPDDAEEVARILPHPPRPSFARRWLGDFHAKGSVSGGSTMGAAAGVGGVRIENDKLSFDLDSAGRWVVRAGQWKFRRVLSAIIIEQVMADGDDGRAARVEFEGDRAVRIGLLQTREITIARLLGHRLSFSRSWYCPWKVPSAGVGS